MDNVIFREYDIRGVYNKEFTNDFAYLLGQAHIRFLQKHRGVENAVVSVGYDARISSPEISKHLIRGMTDSGAKVFELGLITTPISYYSTFTLEGIHGGIMVTGSHNPPEYNGFKISVGKTTIHGDDIQELRRIIEAKDFLSGIGSSEKHDIFPHYLAKYQKEFGSTLNLPVVIDCGNGAAGCIARKLYENTGLKPEFLFEEPDGTFPNHHPDPTVEENLTALKERVIKSGALIGIGFDGDADRIGVVDHEGKMIFGDEIMAIIARDILSRDPGRTIVGDVKCSDRLYADIEKHGGKAVMWKTGHSLVKQKIKEENSPFGGELSGHIFIADRNYGYDDAPYAGLRLIEIMVNTGKNIQQLLEGFGEAFCTPEIRIETTEEKKRKIVEVLKDKYSHPSPDYKVNLIDGTRISFKDGWALARASNTQAVLVTRFESNTKEGMIRIQNEIEAVIKPLL